MLPTKSDAQSTGAWRLKDYRTTLRASDRAEATQRAYMGDIEAFVTWANDHEVTRPNEVNVRALRDYLLFMTERGDERTSIIRRRASLRGYFTWMVQRGHLIESPAQRLSAPKANHRLPKLV
ncbi:MAG TPA: site-specific integrase, partial [Acidimicrobiales bacterium]